MPRLLFEIGMEEMPARFVAPAIDQMAELAGRLLTESGLDGRDIKAMGTPRRLALIADGLLEQQPDRTEVALGPPVKAAFDAQGQPTKAAQGFARSQGVDVADLQTQDTDKGPRVAVTKTVAGQPAGQVLAELLPRLVASLTFPKSMRWGTEKFRFARPIHWLLALLDDQVVEFELAGIKSGRATRGHRFMAPQPRELAQAGDYPEAMTQAQVIVDRAQRAAETTREVEQAAAGSGGSLVEDPELLEEVTDLVELPVACLGSFDAEFLEVPRPVIISAMREHQRYFALEDDQGRLLNRFIAVNNTRPLDLSVVAKGHERVLRARLADARFFFKEDTKTPLKSRLEDLKEVVFHAKLGTSFEKVERFTALATFLARRLAPDTAEQVELAARLAKCDLVTEMVGEFPSLQGVVGQEYALREGMDPRVAAALREHYLPAQAGSPLPTGRVGALVGLADRIDTLCGFLGVGLAPSGAADPYGLRRAAIGVIRLITENDYHLSLREVLDRALVNLSAKLTAPMPEVRRQVEEFLAERLLRLLMDQGVGADVARAVIEAGIDDLTATKARAQALAAVKDTPDFAPLAAGMKRVMNILRKEADQVPSAEPDPALMELEAERQLFEQFSSLEAEAAQRFAAGDYREFLVGLSGLKESVDRFFDDVMVMVEDESLRHNRLALLNRIASLFGKMAQFTHLQL